MHYHHSWVDTLSALLVPLVAVGAVIIGYLQLRTAQNKLKLELFNRRIAVYDAVRTFQASIIQNGKVEQSMLFEFMSKTREAKWLFDDDVEQYLHDELYKKALDLWTYKAEREGLSVGPELSAKVQQESETMKWVIGQSKVMDELFSPFLKLKH